MAQRWYQRATVQAALINAIPTIVAAGIGIVSIVFTYLLSVNAFRQTAKNFDKQYYRDSVNSAHQDSMTALQTDLNTSQTLLASNQFRNDSFYQSKELAIQKNQLAILVLQKHENDTTNQSGLIVTKVVLRNYPLKLDIKEKELDLKEMADYYGYEPELIYEQEPGRVSNIPSIGQCLQVYNRKNKDDLPNFPLLFTVDGVMRYLKYKNLAVGLNDSLEVVKMFIVDVQIENSSRLPITVLRTSFMDLRCNPSISTNSPDSSRNNMFLYPTKHLTTSASMFYPLCCHIENNMELHITINYKTIYGVKTKHWLYKYDFDSNKFIPYD